MRDLMIAEWLNSKYGALLHRWRRDDDGESFAVWWSDDGGLTQVWGDDISSETYAKELIGHQPWRLMACLDEIRSNAAP
ncbi:hypothetical protein BH11PSE10_BH11PSE10_14790 [soil metagenome]